MDMRKLTEELSVAPQILPADMLALQAEGIRALICNRPDGEGNDQPLFAEIEAAARAAGIEGHCLPAESGKVSDEQGVRPTPWN